MRQFQFAVVQFVPNPVRQESVNVGVIVRDAESGEFGFRFLPRGAVVRKLWPDADQNVVRLFERRLRTLVKEQQLALGEEEGLPLVGHPRDENFFARARSEFVGNLQLTVERGVLQEDLREAVQWAYATFVAEPSASGRPINYQALAPTTARTRLWNAFDRRELIGPNKVAQRVVLEGRHAPWTFDLGYRNGTKRVINSLALTSGLEVNLGRALVYKGMVDDVTDGLGESVQGIAVIQHPKDADNAPGVREAEAILKDAGIETVTFEGLDQLAGRVEADLEQSRVAHA